ncbi:hypothetical protein QF035_005675 [Streptomyces umbrinus]|uniref:Uncharacterized protein n=1 Tax=Streptomyces umbrinus TaxID=67370 RepID=A0ABU0SX02_9ACTN|nr:hypothetical protein [Streptomyces umbrinus]MDQ1028093.1 hypothetical protein [Streptomyces umbrinus]
MPGPVVVGWASGAAGAALLAVPAAAEVVASVPTPFGRVPVRGAVPAEPAALSAESAAGPPGRVPGARWSAVGRTGPAAGLPGPVVAPAEPVVAGVTAVPLELVVARWTLTAAPPERVAGLPGPLAVPPPPADRLLEPAAVPPLDAGLPAPVGVGLPEAAVGPTGAAAGGRSASAAAPAEGAPAPGPAAPDAVRPGVPLTPSVVSRCATGSARRCTAGVAGALVSGFGRWARGGTGVTRGPAGRDAVTGRGARCTGTGTGAASSRTSPGASGSSDRTGSRVCEGGSSPETGLADVVSAFLTSPPGAASRTAWDRVPVKEGFCQVLSRPPNPESATPVRPTAARWIGGNPTQPATEADLAPMAVPAPTPVGDAPAAVREEAPS